MCRGAEISPGPGPEAAWTRASLDPSVREISGPAPHAAGSIELRPAARIGRRYGRPACTALVPLWNMHMHCTYTYLLAGRHAPVAFCRMHGVAEWSRDTGCGLRVTGA